VRTAAIVPAAGQGQRLGPGVPKALRLLGGALLGRARGQADEVLGTIQEQLEAGQSNISQRSIFEAEVARFSAELLAVRGELAGAHAELERATGTRTADLALVRPRFPALPGTREMVAFADSRSGVRRLALLPSSRNPRLVFLGVSDDRRNAIFLVESGLTQEGEGKCKPSRRFCSFLYLRTADSRDDHYFSTEGGKQYVLHLSRIRRVEVKPKAKPSRRAPRSSRADVGPGALFESPVFVDELR